MILSLSLILTAAVYLSGWWQIRQTRPEIFTVARLCFFLSGLLVLQLSVGPPMDDLADRLLSAHMVEHLLLMSVVPPLLLLGLPVVPLLRGFPIPLVRVRFLRDLAHILALPLIAWALMNFSFLAWHIPAAYDFALEHETWHAIEHLCFLGTSIFFWWTVLRPWPAPAVNKDWLILLLLVAADLVNTLLSAFLAFCNRPIYSHYPASALQDQVLGASIMWVFGSVAYLIPAVVITVRLLGFQPRIHEGI